MIFFGATNSGKSSIVRNTFLNTEECTEERNQMPYVETSNYIVMGKYNDIRRVGTDTINRRKLGLLKEVVYNILSSTSKDIILEGARCISRPLVDYLLSKGVEVELYWVYSDSQTCYSRSHCDTGNQGNPPKMSLIESEITKSKNFYNDYKDKIKCFKIDTNEVKDFTKLTLDDCKFELDKDEDGERYVLLW